MGISVQPISFTSWQSLRDRLSQYDHKWAFRGIGDANWSLATSLERLQVSPVIEAERYLLTTFQRRAHHHVRDCPPLDDYVEWLALMQHHGTPTRLLDCTRSPYVALLFALERPPDANGQAAIWAVDIDACKQSAIQILAPQAADPAASLGKPDVFKAAFMREHESGSLPVGFVRRTHPAVPYERAARHSARTFLVPGTGEQRLRGQSSSDEPQGGQVREVSV